MYERCCDDHDNMAKEQRMSNLMTVQGVKMYELVISIDVETYTNIHAMALSMFAILITTG